MRVFAIIVLTPFVLLFTGPGIGFCALANLARKDFVVVEPSWKPELNGSIPKLKICTFNAALLPEFITIRNGLRPTKERVSEVACALIERDDDIICLQEAFDSRATLEMASQLKKHPYQVLLVGHRTIGLSSGLSLFSKYPLKNIAFWPYVEKGGIEKYANKGLLAATVQLTKNKIAYIFTTHLSGGAPAPGGAYFRSKQIQQIRKCISEYIQTYHPKDVIGIFLTGDFNIGPDEGTEIPQKNPEWIKHLNFFRGEYQERYSGDGPSYAKKEVLQDVEKRGTAFWIRPSDPITGRDVKRLSEWQIKRECLDHILFASNAKYKSIRYCRDSMNGSSDHLAVRAEFQVS